MAEVHLDLTKREMLLLIVALEAKVTARPLDDGWIALRDKVKGVYQSRYLAEAVANLGL